MSTYGHTLDASLLKLHKDMRAKAFCEKANGADRRELWRMPVALTPGGVVTVTRMAKLARSTFEMGNY